MKGHYLKLTASFLLILLLYNYFFKNNESKHDSKVKLFKNATVNTHLNVSKYDDQKPTGFINGDSVGIKPLLAFWKVGNKKDIIIILHGGPGATHDYLRPEWDSLQKSATVIYYDQRGSGLSGLSNCYNWQLHEEDLDRVVHSFAKGKPVYLAGSSWGSTLALIYTLKHPENIKGLILTGTYEWMGMNAPQSFCNPILNPKETENQKNIKSTLVYTSEIKEKNMVTSNLNDINYKTITANRGRVLYDVLQTISTLPDYTHLKEIKTPTLIFCGDQVPVNGIHDWGNEYNKLLPNSQLIKIKGASHDPWLANPKVFFEKCNIFINETR